MQHVLAFILDQASVAEEHLERVQVFVTHVIPAMDLVTERRQEHGQGDRPITKTNKPQQQVNPTGQDPRDYVAREERPLTYHQLGI